MVSAPPQLKLRNWDKKSKKRAGNKERRIIQVGPVPAEGSKLDMLNCDIIIGIIKHGEYQNDEKK